MHVFLATGLTAGPPHREPNEEIENLVVTWDEAMAMVDRGEIVDGKTLVALLAYDRRRRVARSEELGQRTSRRPTGRRTASLYPHLHSQCLPQQPLFDLVGVVQIVQRDVAEHDQDAVVRVLFVLGFDRPLVGR